MNLKSRLREEASALISRVGASKAFPDLRDNPVGCKPSQAFVGLLTRPVFSQRLPEANTSSSVGNWQSGAKIKTCVNYNDKKTTRNKLLDRHLMACGGFPISRVTTCTVSPEEPSIYNERASLSENIMPCIRTDCYTRRKQAGDLDPTEFNKDWH